MPHSVRSFHIITDYESINLQQLLSLVLIFVLDILFDVKHAWDCFFDSAYRTVVSACSGVKFVGKLQTFSPIINYSYEKSSLFICMVYH